MTRTVSVAEAKKHLSDLLGRVAYGGETVVIAKHGKPVAKLVQAEAENQEHLAKLRGWLEDDDDFFEHVDQAVRSRHEPRARRRT